MILMMNWHHLYMKIYSENRNYNTEYYCLNYKKFIALSLIFYHFPVLFYMSDQYKVRMHLCGFKWN